MADLKLDLVNKISNEKYFAEIELVRLANESNINYQEKINVMAYELEHIALLNAKLGLVEQYFTPPVDQSVSAGNPAPAPVAAQPQQGQTHGE